MPDQTTADITIEGIAPSSGAASRPKLIPIAAVGNDERQRGTQALGPRFEASTSYAVLLPCRDVAVSGPAGNSRKGRDSALTLQRGPPVGRYDLPRVAYGVCVGSVIRGARRGRRRPTMDSSICTRNRCPRYGSRISRQASSSSSSPVKV